MVTRGNDPNVSSSLTLSLDIRSAISFNGQNDYSRTPTVEPRTGSSVMIEINNKSKKKVASRYVVIVIKNIIYYLANVTSISKFFFQRASLTFSSYLFSILRLLKTGNVYHVIIFTKKL